MLRRLGLLALFVLVGVPPASHAEEIAKAAATEPRGESLGQSEAAGMRGAVVAGGAESVDVGLQVLRDGGNAADAAVATLLALTVTDANQFCFGGEVPILYHDAASGTVEVIAGQGAAPKLATLEYFQQRDDGIPGSGLLPATVPAFLDAAVVLLQRHGTRTFADVAAPTLQILDRHEHPWHAALAGTLRRLIAAEAATVGTGGDRRAGLRAAADYFYRGPIAHELSAWSEANGGLLRYDDLAAHRTPVEQTVTTTYRGYTIHKCGPWTQGPYLLQTLQLLEGFDLRAYEPGSADAIHLSVEALKLALADRDAYLADPLFQEVPLAAMLSADYAERRRGLIDQERASLELRPGDPAGGRALGKPLDVPATRVEAASDTTTCLVADGAGNVVAATPSGWSGALCPELGLWLNSRLQSFNLWPQHPNSLEPGKRPRITLTPTLVSRDGEPVLAISVAGGDLQDQVTLQLLLNVVDFQQQPLQAVSGARFSTDHLISSFRQKPPELGSLTLDEQVDVSVREELERRGHRVTVTRNAIGIPTLMTFDPATSRIHAAGDPRRKRHAAAY